MQWAAGGRILALPNIGLKSVAVRTGTSRRIIFPTCGPRACDTGGFILSPDREYAAAAITADAADPHFSWGIGLVRLKPGRDPKVLPTPEESGPIFDSVLGFSPDGRQLVFRRTSWDGWNAGPPTLLAVPLDGGDPVPLTQSGIPGASLVPSGVQQVQWSPDGRWIAFVEGQTLEVVPTAGTSAPRILATNFQSVYQYPVFDFSWSPTSKLIAYACCSDQPVEQLMTVRPDGTQLTNLLKDRPLAYSGLAAGFVNGGGTPQWSPDGSRLLFTAHRISHRLFHVWTIKANGHDLIKVG
jgi:Tol biopolymer transport system component